MKKSENQADVVVLGSHPAAHFVAALLHEKGLNAWCCAIPRQVLVDRLVLINPKLFDLHPFLGPLRRSVEWTATYGARFLGEESSTVSECRQRGTMALVGSLGDFARASGRMAETHGVRMRQPATLDIHGADESGIDITVGTVRVKPKALIVCDELTAAQRRVLGIPDAWETGVMHRYTYARLGAGAENRPGSRPTVAMSLDLKGSLRWGWLLPHGTQMQIAVVEPIEPDQAPGGRQLLNHWAEVLARHGMIDARASARNLTVNSIDLPLAGAMAHEGVANRTLLVGPAGGFFSACGEDIYPNCWSAVFAADVLARSLKETHLQDAIGAYRHEWRTTLGDYLLGPQQNLRFLLPLVYRNQVMTDRLAESIFQGKAIVR
jgi:hypothetical protein